MKENNDSTPNTEKEKEEWIKVQDGLPSYDEYVLWLLEDGNMVVEALDKDGNPWLLESDAKEAVDIYPMPKATYWRKLPALPKDVEAATTCQCGKPLYPVRNNDGKQIGIAHTEEDEADHWSVFENLNNTEKQ